MGHYQSNVRDLEFNLFEMPGATEVFGKSLYADVDVDTARSVLSEMARLATEELAASFADADRNPPVYDPAAHTVTIPESLRHSYQALMDAEYWRLGLPPEIGGTYAPRTLLWSLADLILGSNPAVWMYASGPNMSHTFYRLGTPEQQRMAKLFVDKGWTATMVLTEPDAGSDVGAGLTKAHQQPDGSWHLEGVKRFITSGEHDLSDNIIHYVLARPVGVEGAGGPGTKGLSLFMVPKNLFDPETGELTGRNGVYATNVEHKMGLKASSTCELTFGEREPAKGWLVGGVHDGIRQMFHIIEHARMLVGTKAIATLSTGYLNALAYAKERVQGPDMTQMVDKTAPRVTITHHPDVRRSLMTQKVYAEGLRALVIYTAQWQDAEQLATAAGDTDAAKRAAGVNDLLLPLVKGCGSERAYELLGAESLQTFGGSGFLQDYPLEQYVRDAKIDSLYEGTTAIQSLDLFFRKIVKDQGRSLLTVAGEIKAFVDADGGNGRLKEERAAVGEALEHVQGMLGTLMGFLGEMQTDPRAVYKVGLNTRRLLLAMGDLLIGWLLGRQAEVALDRLDGETTAADTAFYQGKLAAVRFFAQTVLPRLASDRKIIESTNLDLMDLPEEAF